jgi:DtxR family Mn-dependent transcriptional regulator
MITLELIVVGVLLASVLGMLAWPKLGLLARWRRHVAARHQIATEDALKHLHAAASQGRSATLDSLAGALGLTPTDASGLVRRMEGGGWVASHGTGLRLTPDGERLAIEVIRAHRLWERFLADEAGMHLQDIHSEAERREHQRQPGDLEALDAALGYPAHDPHGDPIPTHAGQIVQPPTWPLPDWPLHQSAKIVHLEDEPAAVYRQLLDQGLAPGQIVHVVERGSEFLTIADGKRQYRLAPIIAANVFVTAPGDAPVQAEPRTLDALPLGQTVRVLRLDEALQGFTRRRLLDLGLTPGVPVTAEMRSLFGDPTAYRVRGALVALREDQARHVHVTDAAEAPLEGVAGP